ncbi:hypothetical protein LTR36_005454 [Oleoguttula mirabilis]|uniref:Small ribosomal subunit protein uS5m n=1 Tax=Oleoguttula mirabilis TaxID=1507867 RepID=A0AAV9JFE7_9PEZI|nr:hypothetical protein LTR36_005454 [Oleoguttula mirabilis]
MASKTYQCLSCRLKDSLRQPSPPIRRQFHASTPRAARRRPAYPSVKQDALEAQQSHKEHVQQLIRRDGPLPDYTEREWAVLAMRYTPEQMDVIRAGEKAVRKKHLVEQGRLRGDAFRPTYIDDFATIRPLVDKPVRLALDDAAAQAETNTPADKRDEKTTKLRIPGVQYSNEEEDPHMTRLCQQTGLTKEEIRRIRVKNLVSHRVVNQTRMGKIQSLYYLTIAGNQDGMLGIGEGKAAEDEDGRRQAMMNAIRNMKPIPRYEERTIYGNVEAKVGAAVVQLSARAPGFGNRCQHLIFELARAAGISDLAARTPRSRNKMNVVKAAFEALTSQRLPEDVARARGRKMVDVRKVYYGGQVY